MKPPPSGHFTICRRASPPLTCCGRWRWLKPSRFRPSPPDSAPPARLTLGPPPPAGPSAARSSSERERSPSRPMTIPNGFQTEPRYRFALPSSAGSRRHHCRLRPIRLQRLHAGSSSGFASHPAQGEGLPPALSSERVCVDCVLKRQIELADGVREFASLRRRADAAAGGPGSPSAGTVPARSGNTTSASGWSSSTRARTTPSPFTSSSSPTLRKPRCIGSR